MCPKVQHDRQHDREVDALLREVKGWCQGGSPVVSGICANDMLDRLLLACQEIRRLRRTIRKNDNAIQFLFMSYASCVADRGTLTNNEKVVRPHLIQTQRLLRKYTGTDWNFIDEDEHD